MTPEISGPTFARNSKIPSSKNFEYGSLNAVLKRSIDSGYYLSYKPQNACFRQ